MLPPTWISCARACEVAVGRLALPETPPDIHAECLFHEKLLVVAGRRSKWFSRRKVRLADLIDEPWIQTRREVEPGAPTFEAFKSAGLGRPRVSIFSESLNLRYSLLETGPYISMIPASAWGLGAKRITLKVLPIEVPPWGQPIAVSVLKDRTLSPMAQAFVASVREAASPLLKRP